MANSRGENEENGGCEWYTNGGDRIAYDDSFIDTGTCVKDRCGWIRMSTAGNLQGFGIFVIVLAVIVTPTLVMSHWLFYEPIGLSAGILCCPVVVFSGVAVGVLLGAEVWVAEVVLRWLIM